MKKDFKGVVSRIRSRIKPENKAYIKKNLAISEQIICILKHKGWSQKDFAEQLGKETSEVSKWLSGLHNITLQSITKMESVFGEDIIITPLEACEKYKQIQYVVFKVYAKPNEITSEETPEYSETLPLGENYNYSKAS
jgi:transcriptional regulator with XRE-family HTH domain